MHLKFAISNSQTCDKYATLMQFNLQAGLRNEALLDVPEFFKLLAKTHSSF